MPTSFIPPLRHSSPTPSSLCQLTLRSVVRIPPIDREIMLLLAHRILQTRPLLDGLQPLPESSPGGLVAISLSLNRKPKTLFVMIKDPQTQLGPQCQQWYLNSKSTSMNYSPPKAQRRNRSNLAPALERTAPPHPSPQQILSTWPGILPSGCQPFLIAHGLELQEPMERWDDSTRAEVRPDA